MQSRLNLWLQFYGTISQSWGNTADLSGVYNYRDRSNKRMLLSAEISNLYFWMMSTVASARCNTSEQIGCIFIFAGVCFLGVRIQDKMMHIMLNNNNNKFL